MMYIEFSKRKMLKMVLHSMWLSAKDVGWWVRENSINLFIQVFAYCLIVFGVAGMIWGLLA